MPPIRYDVWRKRPETNDNIFKNRNIMKKDELNQAGTYTAPELCLAEISVESGFAFSGEDQDQTTIFINPYGEGETI